jgi:peptide/nickel transport system permease protein
MLRRTTTVFAFLAKRFATFLATLAAATVLTFLALEVLPGDPARVILGVDAPDSAVAALRARFGLDAPPLERYLSWIGGLVQGRFGTSYTYSVPVIELIGQRLAVTVPLALLSMALATILSLLLGVYAAANHNRGTDVLIMGASQLGISVPSFWLSILLILLFAVNLNWLPAGGFPGWSGGIGPGLAALLLPAVALATVQAAILARFVRSAVLDTMREDYVRTARAKGLTKGATLWRHVLRNALIPVVTVIGLQFANLLAGTIVIENVFALPGIGRLALQAISNRDIMVVRDLVVLIAATVIVVNLLVDVAYAAIDPRLRAGDV